MADSWYNRMALSVIVISLLLWYLLKYFNLDERDGDRD